MSSLKLISIINKEINEFFESNDYSLEDELILFNEILLGELLNPNNAYEYSGSKGFYLYRDMNDVEFFVRLVYQPTNNPYFELKTGWLDKGKPIYEPSIPPVSKNSSAKDWDKRSDTVAKIFKDEIIPFFKKQELADSIVFKPVSNSRIKFASRLVDKFVDKKEFEIIKKSKTLIIKKIYK